MHNGRCVETQDADIATRRNGRLSEFCDTIEFFHGTDNAIAFYETQNPPAEGMAISISIVAQATEAGISFNTYLLARKLVEVSSKPCTAASIKEALKLFWSKPLPDPFPPRRVLGEVFQQMASRCQEYEIAKRRLEHLRRVNIAANSVPDT